MGWEWGGGGVGVQYGGVAWGAVGLGAVGLGGAGLASPDNEWVDAYPDGAAMAGDPLGFEDSRGLPQSTSKSTQLPHSLQTECW